MWTELNDMLIPRNRMGQSGAGTQTSAVGFGGQDPGESSVNFTETWNGTSWSRASDMNTTRNGMGAAGSSSTSALGSAGSTGSVSNATEEWYGDGLLTLNITTS